MTIGRDYMLKTPSGPSAPAFFLHTQVVPLAVNAAGGVEVALQRLSARTGVRSSVILAGLAGLGTLGLFQLLSRRRDPAGEAF